MKLAQLSLCSVALLVIGCETTEFKGDEQRALNVWISNSLNDMSMENAIISQQTLFPYHFVTNSGELNELGKSDLEVLAAHYRYNPGELSIRKGGASDETYDARVNTTRKFLESLWVDPGSVNIVDAFPGGDGATSDRVLKIMFADDNDSGPVGGNMAPDRGSMGPMSRSGPGGIR